MLNVDSDDLFIISVYNINSRWKNYPNLKYLFEMCFKILFSVKFTK